MKVLKKSVLSTTLLMLSSFGFIARADDVTLSGNHDDISSIAANESSSNPFSITTDSDLDGSTLTGTDAIELDVCNNNSTGFVVSVESANGGYFKIESSTSEYARIKYTIHCDDFLTISGETVPAADASDLTSSINLFDYGGGDGAACPAAAVKCTIAAHSSEDLDEKYGGTYSDTKTFTITNS